jgi:predicted Rossmann fold flavoprotein
VEEPWARELQGLAWPDTEATLWPIEEPAAPARPKAARPLCVERAEILFTHFGISGPAILDVSNAFVREGLARAILRLDFFPDRKAEELEKDLLERFRSHPNRGVARALEGLLPARLLDRFEKSITAGAQVLAGQLPREARRALLDLMKATTFHVNGTRGIEFGEVTAGGVEWKDIDPATLESRLAPGLYFAGEILDIAGRCGGFNLQAAFSTGYLAGQSAARHALERTRTP